MNPKLSVCIVSNIIDDKLHQAINSFRHTQFEICLGFNGLSTEQIADFSRLWPDVSVFNIPWEGYGNTKNALASSATADWILSIDSDEIADEELKNSLQDLDLTASQNVFALQRIQKIGAQQIRYGSFGAPEWKNRLYNRQSVQWNQEKVHEELIIESTVKLQKIKGVLWHLTSDSIDEIKTKNNHYAQLSAENMFQNGKKTNGLKPEMAGAMAFIKQYFFKKGILDGSIGLQLALESARYAYLKYTNLKRLQKRN